MAPARLPAFVCFLMASLLASPCTSAGRSEPPAERPPAASGSPLVTPAPIPSPTSSPLPRAFLPTPDAPIPTSPRQLARALVKATRALQESIHRWRTQGSVLQPAPHEIVLQALYQQRICRALAADPSLASATIPRLPRDVRLVARTVVRAAGLFHGLVRPVSNVAAFRTGPPRPAGLLLRFYREAERRFGIEWDVLASLNYIESKFGRVRSTSYAGAQGPMQFIPSTWAVYGMGGDIHDPHDAILGAANYLHRSGAPSDYRRALYAYNHAAAYVSAVLLYARLMRRDVRNYFALYNWQVFVLTTKGSRRLTGPGLAPTPG